MEGFFYKKSVFFINYKPCDVSLQIKETRVFQIFEPCILAKILTRLILKNAYLNIQIGISTFAS